MGKVLRRKMWRLAVAVACAAAMVVGVASIVISSLRSADELRVANLQNLALIRCEEASFEGDP
jgi:anti-sigma-K factor RskA